MSNKKQNGGGSGNNILAGIIGAGIGLLAGFVVHHFVKQSQKQKESANQIRNIPQINYGQSYEGTPQDKLEQMMMCPITLQVMRQPMTIPHCGHSFEKKTIYQYVSKHGKCPLCRKQTTKQSLVPNYQLKNVIQQYKKTKK